MLVSLVVHRSALGVVAVVVGALVVACSTAGPQPAAPATQAPVQAASGVNQTLIDAARKEGTVVWYTSVDTSVAEEVGKKFEARYSGMKVDVNRSGSERVMQRVMQEAQSSVKAVDVVHTSDAGNFVDLKNQKMILKYTPGSAEKYASDFKDKDGYYFAWR